MNSAIKIGLIGTGRHGSRYANHLLRDFAGKFELTAMSRRSGVGKSQAEGWGIRWYPDWRELVASSQVEAVISATTPNLNSDIAHFCVEHRKPLLMEKPLTTDFAQAFDIVELFRKQNIGLTVAQTLRFNNVVLKMRELFPEMGELYSLGACHRMEPSTLPWLEDPQRAGGGVIFHLGVHVFDAIRFITGQEVIRVRASARKVFNPGVEDLVTAEFKLENGAMGLLDSSKVALARVGRYEFVCEKGQLQGDQVHGGVQKVIKNEIFHHKVPPPEPALLPLLAGWYQYLAGYGKNPVSAEDGLAAVRLCCACQESIKKGGWVELAN